MRLLRVFRAVLWSIFGVRRREDATRDLEGAGPGTIIAVAAATALLVIATVAMLVQLALGTRDARESAPSAAAAPAAKLHGPVKVPDTMAERVRPCALCHGAETQATPDGFSPRIAGKPAGYLFNQLASFRDGRRSYPAMVYLVQYMSDDYLREIADHFSKLELPYPAPEKSTLAEAQASRARNLVEKGDAARGVPACIECHGKSLAGAAPAIPGVLGLPRQYMNAQFGAWRAGRLRSVGPDCMAEVARRLAEEDVPLVTAWLASQPVSAKPAPATGTLPLECGSLSSRRSASPGIPSRGEYLATAGDCIACHTAIGGAPFAGGRAIETPFGTVYSSNLTPDEATGIGRWSRDDFWRALHEGRSKDGHLLYPAFPYANFTQVTREDADAMFDYLRALPAVARVNTPHAVRFPYNTQLALAAWRALFFREGGFAPDAARDAQWNRGAYLVRGLGHCDACHAARNALGAVSHSLDLGGGLIPMQNWYAPPLLSSGWPAADIAALLRTGAAPRATAMGPMAEVVYRSTQHLTPEDARAIAAYLQSSPSTAREEPSSKAPDPRTMARGAAIYGEHCAQCHGDRGEGAAPAYPPLAANPGVNAPVAANAIKAVLNGGYAPVTPGNPRPFGMPPYFGVLSDPDIAAVLTYIRASWGNRAAPVPSHEIEKYR